MQREIERERDRSRMRETLADRATGQGRERRGMT